MKIESPRLLTPHSLTPHYSLLAISPLDSHSPGFAAAAASSSRVYGCRGAAKTSAVMPLSTIWPCHMTSTRSQRIAHHGEVVRDEQHGEGELTPQATQEGDELRLHRDIEPRDDLVGNKELRLRAESARDVHPLLLPAGELGRIAFAELGGQADFGEQHLRRAPSARSPPCSAPRLRAPASRCSRPAGAG